MRWHDLRKRQPPCHHHKDVGRKYAQRFRSHLDDIEERHNRDVPARQESDCTLFAGAREESELVKWRAVFQRRRSAIKPALTVLCVLRLAASVLRFAQTQYFRPDHDHSTGSKARRGDHALDLRFSTHEQFFAPRVLEPDR